MKPKLELSEKQIETGIIEYLNWQKGCFAFKVQTTGVFDPRRGCFRPPGKGVMPGTPDIICVYSVHDIPLFIGLEVKSRKGKQSPNQKDFESNLKAKCGGHYFVVRSIADTREALTKVSETLSQADLQRLRPHLTPVEQPNLEKSL